MALDTRIRELQCNLDTCGPGKHSCPMIRYVGAIPSSGQRVVWVAIPGGTFEPSNIASI